MHRCGVCLPNLGLSYESKEPVSHFHKQPSQETPKAYPWRSRLSAPR